MEFNKHKHSNNECYLSQHQHHWPVSGKLRTKGGPDTFVELIRVRKAARQQQQQQSLATFVLTCL